MTAESLRLSSQIQQARERLGLSQSEAAKAWGVPLSTLKKWEQATRTPRGETLDRLWPILFPEPKRKRKAP